jgi:hypothetical protein
MMEKHRSSNLASGARKADERCCMGRTPLIRQGRRMTLPNVVLGHAQPSLR